MRNHSLQGGIWLRGSLHARTLAAAMATSGLFCPALATQSRTGIGGETEYQELELTASDGDSVDYYGDAVVVSGDRVVVGSETRGCSESGSVYVFERDAEGAWQQVAKLVAPHQEDCDHFGWSLALSAKRLVVGAIQGDGSGPDSGAAYVFERRPDGAWHEVAKLAPSDPKVLGKFGYSVALSSEIIIVGAPVNGGVVPAAGAAYVFERDAAGVWQEMAKLAASDGEGADFFGASMALSGETVVVGAPQDSDLGPDSGAVYVFERDADGLWQEVVKLLASDGSADRAFGSRGSVALGGDTLIVGDAYDRVLSGSAYVYERDAEGMWQEVAKLRASDAEEADFFGGSVGFSVDRVLIGALGDDDLGSTASSAYVFERETEGVWHEVAKLTSSDGEANDNFGQSVAVDGETLVVGALYGDGAAPDSGTAYVFTPVPGVGGSVSGLNPLGATCRNRTSGQTVSIPLQGGTTWDCEAAGLVVAPGNRIEQQVRGVAVANVAGGTVTGMGGRKVVCGNLTTRQEVVIPLGGATSWDCTGAGLVVAPEDRIVQTVSGTAD